jgi:hypothetical protein
MEASGVGFPERGDLNRSIGLFAGCGAKPWHRVIGVWRKTLDILDTYPAGYQVKYCGALKLGVRLLGHFSN